MSYHKITVNGRKVWQARVALGGERLSTIVVIDEATGEKVKDRPLLTRDDARKAEAALLRALEARHGRAAQAGAAPATLRKLFEFYIQDLEDRGKSGDVIGRAQETAHAVERLMPALLDRPVSTITDADVFAFRKTRAADSGAAVRRLDAAAKLRARAGATKDAARRRALEQRAEQQERGAQAREREGTKPATVNRDLRVLRAMLKRARPDFRFPAGIFFKEDATRVRWLRPEDELLVFETMPSPFRELARLAALTLMRLTEIRTLRREFVRLEQGVVMLPKAKAGARAVVLSFEAQKILAAQLARHESDWIFPSPTGEPYSRVHVSRVFRRAARAAGLRDFTFHDLRHHGATQALNRGFTTPILMALGGWKTEAMVRRYAAVTDATLRAAAEAVAGHEPTGAWAGNANGNGAVTTRK
jgi:integrase